MKFTYEIPGEFKDEDIWLRYFSKTAIISLLISFLFAIFLSKFTDFLFGTMIPGIVLGGLLMIVVGIVTTIKVPESNYLTGAGNTLYKLFVTRYIRKKHSCIYVLGYGEKEDEY